MVTTQKVKPQKNVQVILEDDEKHWKSKRGKMRTINHPKIAHIIENKEKNRCEALEIFPGRRE